MCVCEREREIEKERKRHCVGGWGRKTGRERETVSVPVCVRKRQTDTHRADC